MSSLSKKAIESALRPLAKWRLGKDELVADFTFPDFAQAIQFVSSVAEIAEELDHHPDIDIRYNKVRLSVFSHDVGHITDRDLKLAARVQEIATG